MDLNYPWFSPEDRSAPVFTARKMVSSKFDLRDFPGLPPKAVLFCLGKGLPLLEERFGCETLIDPLNCFINTTKALMVSGHPEVCFVHGGRGAPATANTVEVLHALGVEKFLLVGLCGGFGKDLQVGDVLAPRQILSEEGASRHYRAESGFVPITGPSDPLRREEFFTARGIELKHLDTVSTDAVYRQTFQKEAFWRELGCAGVDMEASAMAAVCGYYQKSCEVLLMVSDRHPMKEGDPPWEWGSLDYNARLEQFVTACIEYALE